MNVLAVPLFERLLGDVWHTVPEAVRRLHTFSSESEYSGECVVERGSGWLANCVASVVGLPAAGNEVPVSVRFVSAGGRERWIRTFGGRIFASTMREGSGLLWEKVGPFEFGQALVVDGQQLRLAMRRWTVFGMPLPFSWAPRSNAYETEQDGRFRFHVELSHPWVGPIVRYRGWLQ
jgi:hypothetical protein